MVESDAKMDLKRYQFLRKNSKVTKSKADKKLLAKDEAHWESEWQAKRTARKSAKKEIDEAFKALDAHKDDEIKGFVRENDIVKVGTQYKASWTHLPA